MREREPQQRLHYPKDARSKPALLAQLQAAERALLECYRMAGGDMSNPPQGLQECISEAHRVVFSLSQGYDMIVRGHCLDDAEAL